jgi:hypothetical protein
VKRRRLPLTKTLIRRRREWIGFWTPTTRRHVPDLKAPRKVRRRGEEKEESIEG